jgi:lysophospholipase L1-like esterase
MRIRPWLKRIGGWVRAAWLAVGLALLGVLAVESAYRAQGAVRRALRAPTALDLTPPMYQHEAWYAELARVRSSIPARMQWRPFIEVSGGEFQSPYFNADAQGHRRTIQSTPPDGRARAVYLFGGSNMHGGFVRDSATIASRFAAILHDAGVRDVEVTNFGESGYVLTQEALDLMLRVRAGDRPAIVVFLDGGTDLLSAAQQGVAGIPLIEDYRTRDFEFGRRVYAWQADMGSETRAALTLAGAAFGRLQLVKRFLHGPATPSPEVPVDALSEAAVRAYLGTVTWIEALSSHYGFVPIYAWEPELYTTAKPLSPFERDLLETLLRSPFDRRLREIRRRVPALLGPAADSAAPNRFIDLTPLFDGDSSTVFVDEAHTSEAGSAAIAAAIAARVIPLLDRERPRSLGR